jgi:hypothetical protein
MPPEISTTGRCFSISRKKCPFGAFVSTMSPSFTESQKKDEPMPGG